LPSVRNIDTFTVCIYRWVCVFTLVWQCAIVFAWQWVLSLLFAVCFCIVWLCLCVLPCSVPLSLIECVFNNSTTYRWF
jgi:hypothetical protein